MFIERPWGGYMIVYSSPEVTMKILKVLPGKRLSLQTHALRSEEWRPITGGLSARIGAGMYDLVVGKTYIVDVGMVHRLINDGSDVGYVAEIIKGVYHEEDIERLEDDYGRS